MSAGQTIIRYGELQILHCHTTRMDQEIVLDDSGTNVIGTKFTVAAGGLIHDALSLTQPQVGPIPAGAETAEIERHIRVEAMKLRQRFEMIVGADPDDGSGGDVLLSCNPAPAARSVTEHLSVAPNMSNIDIANGPRCLEISIKHLTAHVFRVEFVFEIVKSPECNDSGQNFNNTGILSISFSTTDEINADFMTTRTWSGQIRSATAKINPHSFRSYAVPVLQQGMRRDKMTFTSSPDGLLLNFEIRDVETHASPPAPATRWSGGGLRYNVTTGDGKLTYVDCSCGLQGDRFADRRKLLALATAIVQNRIFSAIIANAATNVDEITTILEMFAISEHVDNDSASVFVSARGRRTAVGSDVQTIIRGVFGVDPAKATLNNARGNTNYPELQRWDTRLHRGNWKGGFGGPNNTHGGTEETENAISVVTAFSTHLQTECTSNRAIWDGVPGKRQVFRNDTIKPEIQEYKSEIQEQLPRARVTPAHAKAPYSTWKLKATYAVNQHKVQMPLSRFADPGSSGSDLPSSAFIALGPPTATCVFRCDAVRIGEEPVMPAGYSFRDSATGIMYHYLRHGLAVHGKDQRPGGETEHTASVELHYGLDRAPKPDGSENLLVGVTPWANFGIQRTGLNETQGDFFEGQPLL